MSEKPRLRTDSFFCMAGGRLGRGLACAFSYPRRKKKHKKKKKNKKNQKRKRKQRTKREERKNDREREREREKDKAWQTKDEQCSNQPKGWSAFAVALSP